MLCAQRVRTWIAEIPTQIVPIVAATARIHLPGRSVRLSHRCVRAERGRRHAT